MFSFIDLKGDKDEGRTRLFCGVIGFEPLQEPDGEMQEIRSGLLKSGPCSRVEYLPSAFQFFWIEGGLQESV